MPLLLSLRAVKRWSIGLAVVFVAAWLMFIDSHSVMNRIQWYQEHQQLTEENEALQMRINELEEELSDDLSDELIERIAREEYGMQRPDETVYRVE